MIEEGTVVSPKPEALTTDRMEHHGFLWVADGTESALSSYDRPAYVYKSLSTGYLHIWYNDELEGYPEYEWPEDTEVDDGDG